MGYTLRGEEWLLTCATKQLVGSVLAVPDAVTLLAQGDAGVLQQAVVHIHPVTAEGNSTVSDPDFITRIQIRLSFALI